MIYLTSDPHGKFRNILDFLAYGPATSQDLLIILGDAGLNYDAKPESGLRRKAPINSFGVPILCIQGNHELRPEHIPTYREISWHGGTVWQEPKYPNLLFAKDGEIYEVEGRKLLVCGGAYTVFKEYRIARGLPWFYDEQPSAEIKASVERDLARQNWQQDVILTHTCPSKFVPKEKFIRGVDQSTVDTSTEDWLDWIEDRTEYNAWFCGHWHIEKSIGNFRFVYKDIFPLEPPKHLYL